jgi:hypothetical protein
MSQAKIGPDLPNTQLSLDDILPACRRQDDEGCRRHRATLASIKQMGVVETLLVSPQRDAPEKYVIWNGHQRFLALKEMGQTLVYCTVITDKEDI